MDRERRVQRGVAQPRLGEPRLQRREPLDHRAERRRVLLVGVEQHLLEGLQQRHAAREAAAHLAQHAQQAVAAVVRPQVVGHLDADRREAVDVREGDRQHVHLLLLHRRAAASAASAAPPPSAAPSPPSAAPARPARLGSASSPRASLSAVPSAQRSKTSTV